MKLIIKDGWMRIYAPFDRSLIPRYKAIPEGVFVNNKQDSFWRWRFSHVHYFNILREFPEIQVQEGLHEYMLNLKKNIEFLPEIKSWDDCEITDFEFKTEPRPYQKVAFEYLRTARRCLLLDPMGSGKTFSMISFANFLQQTGKIDRCLVFAPKTTLYNFVDEIFKHSFITDAVVVDGTPKKRLSLLGEKHFFYISTWEIVWNKDLLNKLMEMADSRCLILGDEATKIKSHNSLITKGFIQLWTPFCCLSTGTLMTNKGHDVFSPLNYVSSLFKTWTSFANQYCTPGYFGGWELRSDKKSDLRSLVDQYSIRRDKSYLLPWLPEKSYQRRYVDLSKAGAKAYTELAETFLEVFETQDAVPFNVLTELLRLTEITTGFLRYEDRVEWIDNSKLSALAEIVEEVVDESGQKLVLWGRFTPTIRKLMELYGGPPYNAVFIDGSVPTKERRDRKNQFQTDPNIKIMVGQMQAAGIGIDLFSLVPGMECSTAVRLEQEWSPVPMRQSEDRIHRSGQTADSVTIIDLVARGRIDEYILKVVERKERLENELVPIQKIVEKDDILQFLS